MSNKLIVAAAGSGKTTHLVNEALKIADDKVLITTFTEANENEIRKKFYELNGYIPNNITIQTWFSFLIQHGVKPYQSVICNGNVKGLLLVNQKSGLRGYNRYKQPVYFGESDPSNFYFSKSHLIYSDKLAKFVVRANESANGLVIKRIGKIYSHIFIDEVQDMAGYDLEIIKLLFGLDTNILLVGDPRQVTYHTHDEAKYSQYADGNIMEFIEKECADYLVEVDDTTLNKTYRNNKGICCFANSIYPNYKPCEYENKESTNHDGVFFVSAADVDDYLEKYKPMQLRDSRKKGVNQNYPVMTFGESKGLTFERVLIYPTTPMVQWIFDRKKELKNQSRSKFYVAVTRAKFSVSIVIDNKRIQVADDGSCVKAPVSGQPTTIAIRSENLFEVVNILRNNSKKSEEMFFWKNRVAFLEASKSNLTAIPYMAGIMADYETYGLEHLAKELDWGNAMKRINKVKAIRDIRKDAKAIVEKNKESQYQLAYLINLFPTLEDVIDAEFNQLPAIKISELPEYDSVRNFLSKEEYLELSETDRNQLALDRYKNSHSRTKWQIGRDYELYVGYKFHKKGYNVDYYGSYMGLGDLGRDLIAKKGDKILIIQCKYWSSKKQIHEKHVNQLYGTMVSYCIENKVEKSRVRGILISNIELSPMAKKMASYLGIEYTEKYEFCDYPCIKCNIGVDEFGEKTKIYHLPFDQQYDVTKIDSNGEFMAMTVAEAEDAGFRRAYKWHGVE